jgi:hypothetical protein
MKEIPDHQTLRIDRLSGVFRSTTATYKYFWLLALLDAVSEGRTSVPLRSLYVRMIVHAWYPVNYFRLSFGAWDKLQELVIQLAVQEKLEPHTTPADLEHALLFTEDPVSERAILRLGRWVRFRFLSPWLDSSNLTDAQVMHRSQDAKHGAPYALFEDRIEVPADWAAYLTQHRIVLRDFCLWNLAQFIQARNPNVPQVVNKLVRPPSRNGLNAQRDLWNAVMDHTGDLPCIYTGSQLVGADYHMEHFIPYAFVAHDQLWNLVPAAPAYNLTKRDNLPNLERHLRPFTDAHWQLATVVREHDLRNKLLEDYLTIVPEPLHQVTDRYLFGDKLRETIKPLHAIAVNSGFREVEA